jgi:hypothetical protein
MDDRIFRYNIKNAAYEALHGRRFDSANPCANFSYEEMMEMYIADGDSGLIEFLNKRKEDGNLSEVEEEYWKFAMENGMTKPMFRKSILEMHTEDRNKDPLSIKISRMIIKAGNEFYRMEETSSNSKSYEEYLRASLSLKVLLKEKLAGNNASIDTILDENDAAIEAQVRATAASRETPRIFENDNPHLFSFLVLGNHPIAISDYYERIMPQYVERYLEAKREGRLSDVIPNKKHRLAEGISIRDLMGSLNPEKVNKDSIQYLTEEWAKYIEGYKQDRRAGLQFANRDGAHREGRISNDETR